MWRASIAGAALICFGLSPGAQAALRVTAIAAGGEHSLALTEDGTVWVWGAVPAPVSRIAGVVSIAAAYDHDLALRADGTVWEWGNALKPFQVEGLSGVVAVAAGSVHSLLALKSDGTIWARGYNWRGILGDGTTEPRLTPVQVYGLTGVVAIAAGAAHCLALKSDGTVWAWGSNQYGQLGDGTLETSVPSVPARVSGLTGVTAIAAGYAHSLALKRDGTVWTWGVDGTVAAYRNTPEQVSEVAGAVAIAAGMYHSVAVKRDGTVSEWGLSQATPVPVSGLTAVRSVALAAGSGRSLALTNDGTVWEWGAFRATDAIGRPRVAPEQVNGVTGVKAVATGGQAVLALTDNGTVWEWSEPSKPVEVSGLTDVVAIAMGSQYNVPLKLALKGDGTVWEWSGESAPFPVRDLAGVVAIAAGETLRLVVKGDGTVWEWSGESTPTQVSGLSGVVAVSAGLTWDAWDGPYPGRLALRSDGTVWNWFKGGTPVQVGGITGVVAISAGGTSIALKNDGTVCEWIWGDPVQVSGLTGVVAVAAGSSLALSWGDPTAHGLALKEDGTVWAWGDNRFGQLGDGTTTYRAAPVQVGGLRNVAAIAAAAVYSALGTLPVSLAVKRDGTVWAWGFQEFGRLDRSRPAQVIQPGSPDLAIAMSHLGDFTADDQGIYHLRITNDGWTATAGTVTVTDTLPPGLTYRSGFGNCWTCSATDHVVTCTNPGSFNPGASSTIQLHVRVEVQAWPGVTNLATVTNPSDPNTANNTAGDPTVVRQP